MQKALDEGRLKFGDKSNKHVQIDAYPLKQAHSMYVKITDVSVIETAESVAESLGKPKNANNYQKNDVEMVTEDHICDNEMVTEDQYAEKVKVAYPTSEENLVDFLKRCTISNSTTMLCPSDILLVSKIGLAPNKRMHIAGANVMEDPFDDHCHYHHHNIHRHAGCACLECALERELSKSIN